MGLRIAVKKKDGFGINEPLDKPGGGDAINPWPRTCDPDAILIVCFGYPSLPSPHLRRRRMFCLVEGFFGLRPERALEKVDLDNLLKSAFQARHLCRESLCGWFELLNLPDEFRVVGFACLAELLLERVGRKVVDRLSLKHRAFALEPTYRRCQPFEPLLIYWCIRQHIARVAQCDRPILLELSPYLHSLAGPLRWQAEDQQ